MRAQIIDADALRAVSPISLAAFARSEGWSKASPYGDHANVYVSSSRADIIIPTTNHLADYASAVSRLIGIFAEITDQDELVTFRNLIESERDVVRVRAHGNEDDGSIALDRGVKLINHAQEMLLAAACSVKSPQPLYRAGANREATDYMREVRLGQTEHGSFVVTLLSPVPPSMGHVQLKLDPAWARFDEEPIERRVTRRLMDALEASRKAAELALSGDADAFDNAVASGVSANLCEAISGLVDQSQELDVSLTWAKTRPTPEAMRRVVFSQRDAKTFREAARLFRSKQPVPDVILYGTVNKLKREQAEEDGSVTLRVMYEERMQSVNAILDRANYSKAVKAHDEKTPVIVTGDLERIGNRWRIMNSRITELRNDESVDIDITD